MANTYVCMNVHYIFSTKNRLPTIDQRIKDRLWSFIGGIAKNNRMKALCIGGTNNHAHALLSIPATITVAKAVQLLKGGSSKWVNENFPDQSNFAWQTGYSAFSVSASQMTGTIAYILNQEKHHHRKTFQEEYLAFLKKHRIAYDERYLWD